MIITPLGTGSAFTMRNRQTNLLIEHGGKRLLIDCGGDARHSLDDLGLDYTTIDAVYISHAHADHVGGLEWIGLCTHFDPRCERPKLFCQRNLMLDLWDHSLSGGMRGLEGVDASLETYFDPFPVEGNGTFEWQGISFDLVQSVHVSAKYLIMDTFGLMFTCPTTGLRLYHTSDVQFCPETSMRAYYREADWILHDCETSYTGDGKPLMSGVHCHYEQLRTLDPELKSRMTLIHYQDNVLRDWEEWTDRVAVDGFMGLAKRGKVLWDPDSAGSPKCA